MTNKEHLSEKNNQLIHNINEFQKEEKTIVESKKLTLCMKLSDVETFDSFIKKLNKNDKLDLKN